MKTVFRFYHDQLGFRYFDNLGQISTYYFENEFRGGNLSIVYGASIVQELDTDLVAAALYN